MLINSIILRPGELFLKGKNKFIFENILFENIKFALKEIECFVIKTQNRFYIEDFNIKDIDKIISSLQYVFGIHSISPAYKTESTIEQIIAISKKIMPKSGKFRVTTNRADKSFPMTSMALSAHLGGILLSQYKSLRVNLHNFDYNLNIDIREHGFSYIYFEQILGLGGLPIGSSGKAMLLLSGGIDSPVAGYLIAKRGVKLIGVHFHSFPYTSELALDKVRELAKSIAKYTKTFKLIIIPFTEIQENINDKCPDSYLITIMRRFMMRITESLLADNKANIIITGESLGQVASQTIPSIISTDAAIKTTVLRPLIAFDKSEIIELAKKINTYEISIQPYPDCCTVFVPKRPVIKPVIDLVEKYELKLDIDSLVSNALEGAIVEEY